MAPTLQTARLIDTFTAANSTRLGDHTPDTDQHGTGWLEVNRTWEINANQAKGFGAAGTPLMRWLALHDTGQADVQVQVDLIGGGNSTGGSGVILRSPNDSSGIIVQFFWKNGSNGTIDVEVWTSDSNTGTAASYPVTLNTSNTYKLTVQAAGNDITVWLDDTELGTVEVTTHNTATRHGLRARSAVHRFDNFGIYHDAPVAASVSVSRPVPYTVKQSVNGTATLHIEGTRFGGSAIEARLNQIGNETWTVIDATTAGGTFSGQLTLNYRDQGTLEVRQVDNTEAEDTVENIACGNVFVIYGQSNAVGNGTNNQTYTGTVLAAMCREGEQPKALADPTDSDKDPGPAGSPWPLLANLIDNITDAPMMFVTAAAGGRRIDQLYAGTSYNHLVATYPSADSGGALCMIYWQGEADINNRTSEEFYLAAMTTLRNNVRTGLGLDDLPIVVGMTGNVGTGTWDSEDERTAAHTAIRRAQWTACSIVEGLIHGGVFYDVDLSDGDDLHFTTDEQLQINAERFWASIAANFFDGPGSGRGPKLISSRLSADRTSILVRTDKEIAEVESYTASAFLVVDAEDNALSVDSVTRSGPREITITLDEPAPSGVVSWSLGLGRTAEGATVPTETASGYSLPAEPVYAQAVKELSSGNLNQTSLKIGLGL